MADKYQYWRDALAGNFGAASDGHPEAGFYRVRKHKGGPFQPVAIWFDEDGKPIALRDGAIVDAEELWTWVCRAPITEELYHKIVAGEPWPDMDEAVTASMAPPPAGHNAPPDEFEVIKDQIEAALKGVKEYAEIADDEKQARAQSLRARLNELSGEADKTREKIKRPHLEAGKAVDAAWQPLVKAAKQGADMIRDAMGKWETAKARKAAEERRKAEEAERDRLAAIEAGKPAPPPPPTPEPAPAAVAPIKGAYGKAATVKEVKVVTGVTNWDELWGYLKAHPELQEFMRKLAQRALDKGFDPPGVRVELERKVA